MKKNYGKLTLLALVLMLALVACGGSNSTPEADLEDVPVVVDDFAVMAEGRIVPVQYVDLTFNVGGQIAEVLVKEGDEVVAGQVLARLQNAQLEAAVAGAELELIQAQQSYDDLGSNLDLLTAQALQAVAQAEDALRDAQRTVSNLTYGANQSNVDAAEADVIILEDRLEKAQEQFDKWSARPEGNLTRAGLQSNLAQAQIVFDAAVRHLNVITGVANDVDLSVAEADLAVAQAALVIAQSDYSLWLDGPHPDDLASAEGRLNAAQRGLDAAQAALDDASLIAPFAGSVMNIDLKVGEQIAPGTLAAVVADISQWVVETDNLTEIEVPQISVGQSVLVTPDALPELKLTGSVDTIGSLFEEKRGDVTYTVEALLEETDPALRWGMTVVVTFDK